MDNTKNLEKKKSKFQNHRQNHFNLVKKLYFCLKNKNSILSFPAKYTESQSKSVSDFRATNVD